VPGGTERREEMKRTGWLLLLAMHIVAGNSAAAAAAAAAAADSGGGRRVKFRLEEGAEGRQARRLSTKSRRRWTWRKRWPRCRCGEEQQLQMLEGRILPPSPPLLGREADPWAGTAAQGGAGRMG